MKKLIIVGIDFSEGSEHALEYAINLANKLMANILLVWVERKKPTVEADSSFDPSAEVKKSFEELIEKRKDSLKGGKFMYKLRSGKVHKEIAEQAKYHNAYMVVAGTHGTSGFEEFWIGSNAYRIVTSCPCPVVTLRYGESANRDIKKIVFPLDSSRQTRQKLPFAANLAKQYDGEIKILALYSAAGSSIKMLVNGYVDQTEKYLKDHNVRYTVEKRDAGNLTNTTIEYAREVDADLITIMTEQETTTANLLLGPFAQQMVNHSPIPVLSIRPKVLYEKVNRL